MSSSDRIELSIDPGTWDPMDEDMFSLDPIDFHSEEEPYKDRIDSYQKKTGLTEAIQTGIGQLNGIPVAIGVMDFQFMGGSMGSVVGEKITRLIEYATNQFLPLILVCASGGARMQEGSLSLMQMAKISAALYDYQSNKKAFSTAVVSGPYPRSARWPIGIAAFGLCLPLQIRIQNSGSARESAGNNRKEGVHAACGMAESGPFWIYNPSREWSYGNSPANSKLVGALSIPSLEPRIKPPSPSDSLFLLTLYMWAPDIYEGSPTPVTAFLSIAPKISISANISRVSIYGSYGATLQQIFFFCSIASMILGALAAMAQTKVKRPLAHSSIGHVGYIRTGFSCGTIEGIQSLLIGIPPLAGFCSKFYLFFAALGCGAYFLAPVGVVTSVIGRWAAGRLPRVSQFGGPKAVLRAPDT
ncbi:putative proteinDH DEHYDROGENASE [Salix purpurea]|uniref:CoA carboxyltransferase N-terminal domain-containing protein n=1 Tax=Salix purpurea TaxID=77065 RepID=A0A9Q0V3S8_SALPP|nr:putative proteinDH DEHYDROGENASE [Salix purpurea]